MKSSVRLTVIALAGVALIAGMFLGLRPLTASVTQISPEVRTLQLPCGVGFLPGVPDVGTGDLVPLPAEPGVVLERKAYAEHCAEITGWWTYLAWGLTGIGIAGFALLWVGVRSPAGSVLDGSVDGPAPGATESASESASQSAPEPDGASTEADAQAGPEADNEEQTPSSRPTRE